MKSLLDQKVKENRLPRDYIEVGNVIWYSAESWNGGWNCPAEIIEVHEDRECFRVKSLDDCRDQTQEYTFELEEFSCDSRLNMYVPTNEELDKWFLDCARDAPFKSTKITHEQIVDCIYDYFVTFDHEGDQQDGAPVRNRQAAIHTWIIQRWCRKHAITEFANVMNNHRVLFRMEQDAVLCHLTFSSGFKWQFIR